MVQRCTKDMVYMTMTSSMACRVWRFTAGRTWQASSRKGMPWRRVTAPTAAASYTRLRSCQEIILWLF